MAQNYFYKEYKTVDGQEYKIEGYYSMGAPSYPRGYYLSVTKVKREDKGGYIIETIEYDLGTGRTSVKDVLVEVTRKSNKAEEKAFDMITDKRIEELIKFLNK